VTDSRQGPVIYWEGGQARRRIDEIAAEVPVALTYNKRSHVVMMVTPAALEDFAIGFSLTEGIVRHPADVLDIAVLEREKGLEVALTISPDCFEHLLEQRRNLVGRTGCGLCGAESLDQAVRAPSAVAGRLSVTGAALQTAVRSLQGHQPLQAVTGAVHGAAWCDTGGQVLAAREDVGRHNALDKLIGHLLRTGFDPGAGFVLVSSRASYEMVYKTAAAGIELLAAVSAPTTLAIDFALRSGVTLVGFARPGRHNVYTFESRVTTA